MKSKTAYIIIWVAILILNTFGLAFIVTGLANVGLACVYSSLILSLAAGIILWIKLYITPIVIKDKKTDLMTCPHCNSLNGKLIATDTDCEYPEWTYKCQDCGLQWTEYAKLQYIGYNINEENNT